MKILIVDDSKEDRNLIITTINNAKPKQRVSIDESNCLSDALNKIELHVYDLIILDLNLPESDGIETVKTIKKQLEKIDKDIPIIILTGSEDYKIGKEAWLLGIKDYLIKNEIEDKSLTRAISFATCDLDNINSKSIKSR